MSVAILIADKKEFNTKISKGTFYNNRVNS